jgi:type IV pilus assembly protein PilM
MPRQSKSVIGLDLGKSVVKMVEYSRAKNHITTIAKLFLESSDWEDEIQLSKKIHSWISEKKLSKSVEIAAALSGRNSMIRNVEVPEDEKDIYKTLAWEMERYLGSSLEPYLLDYQEISSDEPGMNRKYLAAACRRSEVEKMKRLLKFPSLPLTVLDIDIFAVQNAFEVNYPEYLSSHTLIIKADFQGICYIHTEEARFLSFRFIPVPRKFRIVGSDEQAEIIDRLVNRITSLMDTESKVKASYANIKKLMLCGDLATDPEFCRELEAAAPVELELLDAFRKVEFPHDEEYAYKVIETAPQCATALGLALRYRGDA